MRDNNTYLGGDESTTSVQDASCNKFLLDAINNPEEPLTFTSNAVTQDVVPSHHRKQERTAVVYEGRVKQALTGMIDRTFI